MLAVKENIKNSYIRGYSGKVNWVKACGYCYITIEVRLE